MHKYIYLYIFISVYLLFSVIMLSKGLAKSNIFGQTDCLLIIHISITNNKANNINKFTD